jgi:hypothetical protein
LVSIVDMMITFLANISYLDKVSDEGSSVFKFIGVVISAGTLVILSPVFFIQVTNLINLTSTSVRFSKKSSIEWGNSMRSQFL